MEGIRTQSGPFVGTTYIVPSNRRASFLGVVCETQIKLTLSTNAWHQAIICDYADDSAPEKESHLLRVLRTGTAYSIRYLSGGDPSPIRESHRIQVICILYIAHSMDL